MGEPERRRSYVLAGVGLLAAAGVAYLSSHKSSTTPSSHNDEVDISATGSGSVLVNGQPAPAKLVEPDGTTVHFQATPAAGWRFSHWQGTGGSSTENPLVVKLNTPSGNIEAVFEPGQGLPVVRMGSAAVRRPAWVRDHGNRGPLYGVDGGLAGWVAFGTTLQTLGSAVSHVQKVINSDGSVDGILGLVPSYPVSGGWVSVGDVDVV